MSLILQSIQNQHMSIRWKIAQFTERLWWKNYLRGKSPEDYLRWKQNYWLNFLQACGIEQNLLHGQNVLDAGCGPAGIFWQGVYDVLSNFWADFELTMGLAGCKNVGEINKACLRKTND